MRILVLGGTRFVGRAIVEAALSRDHDVALFNRGTHPDLFPGAEAISGDRDDPGQMAQIASRGWDAVVDVSAYRPSQVRLACDALGARLPHYVYISTVSVYADPVPAGAGEDAPLLSVSEDISADDADAYGGLKVLCERELRARTDLLTVLRPTIVVGPHDYTGRFSWWVRHIAKDGTVPVPPRLDQPVQLIDAADLGAFAVRTVEQRILGTFNTVGPREPLTLQRLIDELRSTFGTAVQLAPVEDAEKEGIPLVLPADGSADGAFSVSGRAAYAAGLQLRPLSQSAREVEREISSAAEAG